MYIGGSIADIFSKKIVIPVLIVLGLGAWKIVEGIIWLCNHVTIVP